MVIGACSLVLLQRPLPDLAWDIALACLLAVGVVFTADITRVSWGSSVRRTAAHSDSEREVERTSEHTRVHAAYLSSGCLLWNSCFSQDVVI